MRAIRRSPTVFWLPGNKAGRGESEMIAGLQVLVKSQGANTLEPGMGSVPMLWRKPNRDGFHWTGTPPARGTQAQALN